VEAGQDISVCLSSIPSKPKICQGSPNQMATESTLQLVLRGMHLMPVSAILLG